MRSNIAMILQETCAKPKQYEYLRYLAQSATAHLDSAYKALPQHLSRAVRESRAELQDVHQMIVQGCYCQDHQGEPDKRKAALKLVRP